MTEAIDLVRLRLLSTNLRVVDARRGLGLTQAELAEQTNFSLRRIADIENLRTIPTDGEMASIASALVQPIDYLFPESLLRAVGVGVFERRKIELHESQIISLTEAKQQLLITDGGIEEVEERADQESLQKQMAQALSTLKPRECLVLKERFGFDGSNGKTLQDIGQEVGVTRSRIMQIEHKALRKLRHPSRSGKLKQFYEK